MKSIQPILFLIACLMWAATALASGDTPPHMPDSGAKNVQAPAVHVTADQLVARYERNEIAADLIYLDKTVVVVGTLTGIGKNALGHAYIVLGGTGNHDGVQCTFPNSAKQEVAKLQKGQLLSVKGTVTGKRGNVQIDNASLQTAH